MFSTHDILHLGEILYKQKRQTLRATKLGLILEQSMENQVNGCGSHQKVNHCCILSNGFWKHLTMLCELRSLLNGSMQRFVWWSKTSETSA